MEPRPKSPKPQQGQEDQTLGSVRETAGLSAEERLQWINDQLTEVREEYQKTPISIEIIGEILKKLVSRLTSATLELEKINGKMLRIFHPSSSILKNEVKELIHATEHTLTIIKREGEDKGKPISPKIKEILEEAEKSIKHGTMAFLNIKNIEQPGEPNIETGEKEKVSRPEKIHLLMEQIKVGSVIYDTELKKSYKITRTPAENASDRYDFMSMEEGENSVGFSTPERLEELLNSGRYIIETEEPTESQLAKPEPDLAPVQNQEQTSSAIETKTYPTSFIEERISTLLESLEKITKVERVSVRGENNAVFLHIKVIAGKKGIEIKTAIEDSSGNFVLKNLEIDAGRLTKIYIKSRIESKFGEIKETLIKEIEKQEEKKVEKVEIKDGELCVTFTKPKPAPAPYLKAPSPKREPAIRESVAEPAPTREQIGEQIKAKEKKAQAIENLKRTIENAQRTLEENARRKKVLLEELEKIRRENVTQTPPTPTPAPSSAPKEGAPSLTPESNTEGKLKEKRKLLENTSKIHFKKRRKLKEEIEELEKKVKREKEIEADKKQNPLKYLLIDKLHPTNFRVMFNVDKEDISLEKINQIMGQSGRSFEDGLFWTPNLIIPERDMAISFSVNGFYLKLKNAEEVRNKKGTTIDDQKARYDLIDPSGRVISSNIGYEKGIDLLTEEANAHLARLILFFDTENEFKEAESLATFEAKKEFMERKRWERILNTKTVQQKGEINKRYNELIANLSK